MQNLTDLDRAYRGSFYTIIGAGGDLAEWEEGYNRMLGEENIGKPVEYLTTTGAQVNAYAERNGVIKPSRLFEPDLVFVLFPLDGLNPLRLPLFRLNWGDMWFDDMIDAMRGQ